MSTCDRPSDLVRFANALRDCLGLAPLPHTEEAARENRATDAERFGFATPRWWPNQVVGADGMRRRKR